MKHIIKLLSLIITFSFVIAGCNKKLDVEPQQNITPDQIRTEGDVLAVLNGAYTLLQNADAFGESYIFAADLLAAENHVDFVGTFLDYRDLINKSQVENNGIALGIWANSYTIINVANTVISKAEVVNENDREAVTAEAQFIRGLVYFNLINFYAKPYSAGNVGSNPGVPLILEPVFSYEPARDNVARSSVEEVYTQIIEDLTKASTDLPGTSTNGKATRYSALAILSRVYLNQAKYAEAATAADEVIESDEYELITAFSGAFNNPSNSREDIFAIQQTSQSNAGTTNAGLTTFYLARRSDDPSIAGGGRGDAQSEAGHLNIFETADQRRAFFYTGASIAGVEGVYTQKWAVFYRNITVVRLAEMYLTRAEANYRKGGAPIGGVDPMEDLNTVRERSGASPLTSITNANIFAEERFRELGFEGDRLWTLKRLRMTIDGLPYDADMLVLPIPQRELDINTSLDQNPGY